MAKAKREAWTIQAAARPPYRFTYWPNDDEREQF